MYTYMSSGSIVALCTILGVFLNAVPALAMSCLEVSTNGSGDCIKVGINFIFNIQPLNDQPFWDRILMSSTKI